MVSKKNIQIQGKGNHSASLMKLTLIIFLFGMACMANAQVRPDWEKEGGIPDTQIEIVKDKKVTLPPADRNFQKIPPRPADPIRHDIVYDYKNLKFNTSDYSPLIRPLKLKAQEISRIYGNFISGGIGNYTSPYLEAYLNSKRDKNQFYGVHFYHRNYGSGPVDKKNSASGATDVSLFGKSIGNAVTASGQLDYQNRYGYFYGYTPGTEPFRPSIRHAYNTAGFSGAVENTKSGDLNYKIKAGYSHLSDNLKASENELRLNGTGIYKLNDKSKIIIDADYYLITRKDSAITYKTRNLFKLRPAYRFYPIEDLLFTAGLNIAAEDDLGSKMHIYPNVRAEYKLIESVAVFAALTGDIDKVTLHSLSADNLWLARDPAIRHTNRTAEFLGGLKGKLGGKVAFTTGVSLATLHNVYSFHNTATDRAKFDITYNNTSRFNLFAELGFNPGDNIKMSLRGDVYSYTTEAIYNRPKYRIDYTSSYNVYDKIWLNVDLIAQGGMKAFDYEKNATVTLPSAFDLNVRADYIFSRRVSAFVKVENLLSNKYQLYLNYPVRGLQFMGGVTCTF